MLRRILFCLFVAWSTSAIAQEKLKLQIAQPGPKPSDAAAYLLGLNMGAQLKAGGMRSDDINVNDFLAGFVDAIKGSDSRVSQTEMEAAMKVLGTKIEARLKEAAKERLVKSMAFLDANKAKQGITTLPSGLQFEVLKTGAGATPTLASSVVCHYEGKLIDGTVFDSSIQRGQAASFPVGQVIPGWTEALSRMKVGDKWRLFIPPALAYGEPGFPPAIGPNEALVFELELLQVK